MYRKHLKKEFYTMKAREDGYPARSVYKLQEIDEKLKVIKKGDKVLDLGCSPGSWLVYLSKKVGEQGRVIGFDIEDVKKFSGNNVIFVKRDIMYLESFDLRNMRNLCQAVVSDLAPKTTGTKSLDVGRSLELSEKALEIAKEVLVSGGNFVCKVFEGEGSDDFFKKVAKSFKKAKRFRPKAVMKESKEFYIVAKGFLRSGM